jgi:steroid delta-isomerase-like uncharacterized protein
MTTTNRTTLSELDQQRDAVIVEHIEAEAEHDIDRALRTFRSPHYLVHALAVEAPGAAAVRDLLATVFSAFPDFAFHAERSHHAADTVIVEGRMVGTHRGDWAGIPGTGQPIDVPTCCLYHFDGADLLSESVYFDHATLLAQINGGPA